MRTVTRTILFFVWGATLAAGVAAIEDPTVLPGTFDIPFKKDLEKAHPRLLFTKADMERWWKEDHAAEKFIWDAGENYFKTCKSAPPGDEAWNGKDWQRITWWRGVTAIMLYAKTGDKGYADHVKGILIPMCKSEHWELGGEQDYGMAAANMMAFVALGYDTIYDLLSEDERALVRKRLWLAADRFYHYGWKDLKKRPKASVRYWQGDPQNNHRWHRLCGYLWGCLAIYGEEPGINGYLAHAMDEAKFVLKWLPQDGSCHESVTYQAFGTQYLVPAILALDNCTGSNNLAANRGFREFPHFRTHMVLPDRKGLWNFGDGGEEPYYFSHYNFKCASAWRDEVMQAAHVRNFKAAPDSYSYHGMALLFYDPTLKEGDISQYPAYRYFPDMGIATYREGWDDPNALAVFFKCAPYGGQRLNEYRDSFNPPHYVNVAHDHPDATEFLIAWKGQRFAQDFGDHSRKTEQHSVIKVNGKDQAGAGLGWTQPIPNMGKRAKIEQYFGAKGFGLVRGDASGFYDDLNRFARTLLYIDDAYVLVSDEITAKQAATIDWYYKCKGDWKDEGKQAWLLTKGGASVRVSLAAPEDLKAAKEADGLKFTKEGAAGSRWLCLIAPQSAAPAEIASKAETATGFVLEIKRGDCTDHIQLGASKAGEERETPVLTSDAEVTIATVKNGKLTKLMLVGGTSLKSGFVSLIASNKVNLMYDVATGRLTITASLGDPSSEVKLSSKELAVKEVNGSPIKENIAEGATVKVPTWQELQDELDGFTKRTK